MDAQELKTILDLHRKWVLNEPDGKRANLRSANLSSADLRSADLSSADLSYANLSYANLRSANLRSADLRSADLSYANLSYANLRSANLRSADLSYANLRSADLRSADLSYANLSSADLRSANLSYANLSYANLRSANLRSADLSYADLKEIKNDFFKVLTIAKAEVLGLYDYLMRGKIKGSSYEGDCACLVGSIANIRHEKYDALTIQLKPDSDRLSERWFLAIAEGDIPQSNPVSDVTATWMREFMDTEKLEYPTYEIVAIPRGKSNG